MVYRTAYAESLDDSSSEARAREREAISRSIDLMELAGAAGPRSREAVVALNYLCQLWTILLEDLANPANGLAPALRANLISIGISVLRQAEDIRLERSSDFGRLIEVSRLIMEGLK